MPTRRRHPLPVLLPLALVLLALPACDTFSNVRLLPNLDRVDPEESRALAELPYPTQVAFDASLDIVLRRDRGHVELVNRTPRAYTGVYLWLNQQYVARVDELTIGDNGGIDLGNFINQHDEGFPTATLLAPDAGDRIVLAELFDPATAKRYRLLVRDDT